MSEEKTIEYWRDRAMLAESCLKGAKRKEKFFVNWLKENAPDTLRLLEIARDLDRNKYILDILNRFSGGR